MPSNWKSATKRVLCVWLPDWPLQRVGGRSAEPERPLVLYREGRGGLRVAYGSPPAAALGVRPSQPLAEAAALLEGASPAPRLERHDPQADLSALRELAGWCQRFSPVVGIEEWDTTDSLLLDVTGCAHLHGGEAGLAELIVREFGGRSLAVRVAVADTIGTAWAVARYGSSSGGCLVPSGRQEDAVRPLPVGALRLAPPVVRSLRELGVERVEQLLTLPRSSLPARFGVEIIQRLDQALGRLPELVTPVRLPDSVAAEWTFEQPTGQRPLIESVLRRLVGQVVEGLSPRQQGIQRFVLHLACLGTEETEIPVGLLRPSLSADHLAELALVRLEQVRLAGEVARIRVRVTATAPLEVRQGELFPGAQEAERQARRELARLVDRLAGRLGERSVLRPRLHPDAQPEYACLLEPLLPTAPVPTGKRRRPRERQERQKPEVAPPDEGCRLSRPLRLLPEPAEIGVMAVWPEGPPVRFDWRGHSYSVTHCWGPERIETGWWRGRQVRRDYYRVETASGQRLWLFRQVDQGRWFLHGFFE